MIHVHSFTDTWQMEFNVSKWAIMQTTNKRSKTDFPYKMKGETLEKVDPVEKVSKFVNKSHAIYAYIITQKNWVRCHTKGEI